MASRRFSVSARVPPLGVSPPRGSLLRRGGARRERFVQAEEQPPSPFTNTCTQPLVESDDPAVQTTHLGLAAEDLVESLPKSLRITQNRSIETSD